ncbi:MAG: cytosolic protein [Armatimonadetes bacterium]|nr:cytosolic protein [Armatimonadota bacterium]
MDCPSFHKNGQRCNCSYPGCSRKGNCCECLHYHLSNNELPACAFPDDVEKTYDRSFARFVRIHR